MVLLYVINYEHNNLTMLHLLLTYFYLTPKYVLDIMVSSPHAKQNKCDIHNYQTG